jgi:hypothetical protein
MSITWKPLALVRVPAKPSGLWELAAEYVGGSRLLRMRVVGQDEKGNKTSTTWHVDKDLESPADGLSSDPCAAQKPEKKPEAILTRAARRGALIAKIGGSTADIPDAGSLSTPYGTKRVFPVGSQCIITLASTDGGPLFFTMNDWPECFATHEGSLYVKIEEYAT